MRVLQTPTDEDLSGFSRFLWTQRLRHRIYEESGVQVIEVADPAQSADVRQYYEQWRSGQLELEPEPMLLPRSQELARWIRPNPAVATLLVLALLSFALTLNWPAPTSLAHWFTFTLAPNALVSDATGQLWRWFTPALLHFSVLHLAFNAAIVWELGRRIEVQLGSLRFVLLVLVLALVSNWAQYLWTPGATFGGLSGVAYGLLGFIVASAKLRPSSRAWELPQGIALSLLIFLVLFSTGVTTSFGLYVANAAHWGGLLCGLACAVVWHRLRRQG